MSTEESACEKHFSDTTIQEKDGRFVVSLPKKESVICKLGGSKATALKRFLGIERRLMANETLRLLYTEFIHEYMLMGHMVETNAYEAKERTYYMPHHAVIKPGSTTTKLRVVFDASCATSTGISLNNALMVGPVV
ncbi:uncharacterized protein LOC129729272 [Wyeomyia smithii]|uniref:uncharacterized protein LOC129729272 n=1 Tax=Wyeomyia smithii TaxID=174621 RepID=UPI002467DF25|nr:uncharacterized protein LOC129729272 [Wyeomyia smithii]